MGTMKEFIPIAELTLRLEEYPKENQVTEDVKDTVSAVKTEVERSEKLTHKTNIGDSNTLYIGIEEGEASK